jgi:cytochrome b pre-mRNA-processing protein 3
MFFQRWLAHGPAKLAGRALAKSAARQGRAPFLYSELGAPDTIEGRFEILTMHVILLAERLAEEQTRQALFDAYLADLDGALREMGVGDLTVGKRMRKLGEAFYGRARSWRAALAKLPDEGDIRDVLARTVFDGVMDAQPSGLARYAAACHRALAGQEDAVLARGEVTWPRG